MSRPFQHLYNDKRWKPLRKRILQRDRHMCQCDHCQGKGLPADVVDHKVPHKGKTKLFWDTENLQAMAKVCHDKFKASQERGGAGFNAGCGEDGQPLNPSHEWYS